MSEEQEERKYTRKELNKEGRVACLAGLIMGVVLSVIPFNCTGMYLGRIDRLYQKDINQDGRMDLVAQRNWSLADEFYLQKDGGYLPMEKVKRDEIKKINTKYDKFDTTHINTRPGGKGK